MGLLQKLSDSGLDTQKQETPALDKPGANKKSNTVGLLKKSLMASDNRRLDFFEFTGKYNLEMCALLKNQNGTYSITACTGIDGESICLSTSTQDFWAGTITQANKLIYSYDMSTSDALPFLQFFSSKLKKQIKSFNIIKTKNNSIFIFFNKPPVVNEEFILDIQTIENTDILFENSIENSNSLYSYKIDFSEALESFILSNSKNQVHFSTVIVNELYHNLCINFPAPSKLLYSSKGSFTLFTDEQLPIELLYNHIKLESNFILDNHSELLSVSDAKNSL